MAIRFTRDFLSVFLRQPYSIEFLYSQNYQSDSDFHYDYVCTVPAFCQDTALSTVGSVLSSLRSAIPSLRLVPDSDFYVSAVLIPEFEWNVLKVVLRSI